MFPTKIYGLLLPIIAAITTSQAQSIRELYNYCNPIHPQDTVSRYTPGLTPYIDERRRDQVNYLLHCEKLTTLYNRRIQKIVVRVSKADTVEAVRIYLPFDTLLHKEIEAELGKPDFMWMAIASDIDIDHIIADRRWKLNNYLVLFQCTRYLPTSKTSDDGFVITSAKEDYIILSIVNGG